MIELKLKTDFKETLLRQRAVNRRKMYIIDALCDCLSKLPEASDFTASIDEEDWVRTHKVRLILHSEDPDLLGRVLQALKSGGPWSAGEWERKFRTSWYTEAPEVRASICLDLVLDSSERQWPSWPEKISLQIDSDAKPPACEIVVRVKPQSYEMYEKVVRCTDPLTGEVQETTAIYGS